MQMTLEQFTVRFPGRGRPVSAEYAGQWIAWNGDRSVILAHGTELSTVRQQAIQLGCACPVLQKVPHGPFVGSA